MDSNIEVEDNLDQANNPGHPVKLKHQETKIVSMDGGVSYSDIYNEKSDDKPKVPTNSYFYIYGISDYSVYEIVSQLFLSSIDAASNSDNIEKYNITHILNVAPFTLVTFPQVEYLHIPLEDLPSQKIFQSKTSEPNNEPLIKCIDFINNTICSSNNNNVLVHCAAGVSRSSTMCIAYLMKYRDFTFKTAFQLVKQQKPDIMPNPGFVSQLREFEKYLQSNKPKN